MKLTRTVKVPKSYWLDGVWTHGVVQATVELEWNEEELALYFAGRCLATKSHKSEFQEGQISATVRSVSRVEPA